MRFTRTLFPALTALVLAGASLSAQTAPTGIVWFDQYLDALRQQAGIPGLSAALASGRQIVWERAYGFQDVESSIRTSPDTLYDVGDMTQTFAATLALQCVERGALRLDDPVGNFALDAADPGATIRQVLSHSLFGATGTRFRYDPARFATADSAIDSCSRRGIRLALAQEILDRLVFLRPAEAQDTLEVDRDLRGIVPDSIVSTFDFHSSPFLQDGQPRHRPDASVLR